MSDGIHYLCRKHEYGWCYKCSEPAIYRFFVDHNINYFIIYCCDFHKPTPPKYYGYCDFKGCSLWAEYCHVNDSIPRYCNKHKPNNVPIMHTLSNYCSHQGCSLIARYGVHEDIPIHCEKHKKNLEILL